MRLGEASASARGCAFVVVFHEHAEVTLALLRRGDGVGADLAQRAPEVPESFRRCSASACSCAAAAAALACSCAAAATSVAAADARAHIDVKSIATRRGRLRAGRGESSPRCECSPSQRKVLRFFVQR